MRTVTDPAALLDLVGSGGIQARVHDGGLPRRRFTARAGWDTGERCLADHLVYAVHHGQANLAAAGGAWRLGPGRVCVIPPGVAFRVVAGVPAPRLTRLRLALDSPDEVVAWGSEPVVCTLTPELLRVLDLLADASATAAAHAAAWERAGAHLLLAALLRAAAPRGAGALTSEMLALCEAVVGRDPRTTPRDLARACGLTHDWFSRAFVRAVGRPPRRWLVELRVRRAAERLAAGRETAWTVAQGLGWSDPKLFGRQFRAVMGAPPGRWRRQV